MLIKDAEDTMSDDMFDELIESIEQADTIIQTSKTDAD